MHRSTGLLGILTVVSTMMASASLAANPQFSVIDLGPTDLPGGTLNWANVPAPQNGGDQNLPSLGGGGNVYYGVFFYGQTSLTFGQSMLADNPNCAGGATHAALWLNGSVTDLGTIATNPNNCPSGMPPFSSAYGANTVGDVVGVSDIDADAPQQFRLQAHAFLWNGGVMHDLGTLAGSAYGSEALGVNDSHEVVGTSDAIRTSDGAQLTRAFLYANGTLLDLSFFLVSAPSLRLTSATAIDCQGNIAAVGSDMNGDESNVHEYLLVRQGAARSCPSH